MITKIKITDFLNWLQVEVQISNMLKSSIIPFPGEGQWSALIKDCKIVNEKTTTSVVGCSDTPDRALLSFVEKIRGHRIRIGDNEFEVPQDLTV